MAYGDYTTGEHSGNEVPAGSEQATGGLTQAMAQAYYNTLTPEQRAQVDATGGPRVEWLQAAIDAGVPDAIAAAGGTTGAPGAGQPAGAGGGAGSGLPNWDHREADLMTQHYNRLVADGVSPKEAERIVRIALGGVQHDYAANYAFTGGALGGSAEDAVNTYRGFDQFYNPNCPPNKPYNPDMSHIQQWAPNAAARMTGNECVEKPIDTPDEFVGLDAFQPKPKPEPGGAEPAAPTPEPTGAGYAGGEAGTAGTPAPPPGTPGSGVTGDTTPQPPPGVTFSAGSVGGQGLQAATPAPLPDPWAGTQTGGGDGGGADRGGGDRQSITGPRFFGGGGGRNRSGWSSGGGWVTSDRRAKTLGLQDPPRTKFSDWRR